MVFCSFVIGRPLVREASFSEGSRDYDRYMIDRRRIFALAAVLFCALNNAVGQGLSPDQVEAIVKPQIKIIEKWARDPVIVKAVSEQNGKKLSLSEIQAIDKTWIANSGDEGLIRNLESGPCAGRLRYMTSNTPLFIESFVMDNQGALVGMTRKTSDYWQGDEAKWKRAFNGGKGAVFIDRPQYDTSAKTILVQVSAPIRDAGGAVIGAITVGINIDKLRKESKSQ
jgi:hypothetical protein